MVSDQKDCICSDGGKDEKNTDTAKSCADLLDNLTDFLAASADLVKDLKQTIETTESKTDNALNESESKDQSTTNVPKNDNCGCNVMENTIGDSINLATEANEISVAWMAKISNIGKENPTDNAEATPSSICKSQCSIKGLKSKDNLNNSQKGRSKPQQNKKQLNQKFTKEKNEKITKLKENVTIVQKNLSDIQEQLRQLERLFQDYTSMNTSQGQVNAAALYKEIMKPQSVPYLKPSKLQTNKSCVCAMGQSTSSISSVQVMVKPNQQNPNLSRANHEKVLVLSAIPLDQSHV